LNLSLSSPGGVMSFVIVIFGFGPLAGGQVETEPRDVPSSIRVESHDVEWTAFVQMKDLV